MLTYIYVGICQGGVCALACGNSTIEAVIEIVKIATIRVANVFLSSFCTFSFSPIFLIEQR
jgi:hypothetical protein